MLEIFGPSRSEKSKENERPRILVPKHKDITDLDPEFLETLDLPELYEVIHKHLDSQKSFVENIRENIRFKLRLFINFVQAVEKIRGQNDLPLEEIHARFKESELKFRREMEQMGTVINFQSEISQEMLSKKGYLMLATHQGGALETYTMKAVTGINMIQVGKDELTRLPYFGEAISRNGHISVHRDKVKIKKDATPQERAVRDAEIASIAEQVGKNLATKQHVVLFFEGTRSKNGLIANTDARQDWCMEITTAIEEACKKLGVDYGKGLLVLDTLSVLPIGVEEKRRTPVRVNGDCSARLIDATNLPITRDDGHEFNSKTFLGTARLNLKEMLIERIRRYQSELKAKSK